MTTMNNEDHADPSVYEPRELPEPAAWVRDLESPQPHCVTSLWYRSKSDADAGTWYAPLYTADQMREAIAEFAGKPMCKPCAEAEVLACQVNSLRDALVKVLDTREKEADAWFAYETARDNFTGGAALESRRHLAMMQATSRAEKEARVLLATLKTPNVKLTGPQGPVQRNVRPWR